MLAHLLYVSLRSLLLALLAGGILWMVRKRRTAALEHAVWTAVLCGMLALFVASGALPRMSLPIAATRVIAPPAVTPATSDVIVQGPTAGEPSSMTSRPAIDWSRIVLAAYAAVALAFLLRFAAGFWLARNLLRGSRPAGGFLESDRITVPLTVGWLRPTILLPIDWREWAPEKLNAVLDHEGAHVRRRDGLVAALAAVNRCLFWFHPLAWILERRLALLAEHACDESCVAATGDRHGYARLLLEMAMTVDGSHGRLRSHALTMAAPSHIRRRIDSLLEEGRTFTRGLTKETWMGVLLAAVPLVWCAGAVELHRRPVMLAQTQPALTRPANTPKFEVASIKLCDPSERGGKSAGGRGGGGTSGFSAGRLNIRCMALLDLMKFAYIQNSDTAPIRAGFTDPQPVRGGPAWVSSARYSIEAKSDDPAVNVEDGGPAVNRMLVGPMLQKLLEERFHLKIHSETEDVPMYALTVAKGGLKIKPMEEGGCIPHDPSKGLNMKDVPGPGEKPLCINHVGMEGPNWTMDAAGTTFAKLSGPLGGWILGRPVIDRTGTNDLFILHLKFARDESTPGQFPADARLPESAANDVPAGPSVFTALEQLGLKLVPEKGPRGFIVIDHIERPTEN